jgi:hypothetical protein
MANSVHVCILNTEALLQHMRDGKGLEVLWSGPPGSLARIIGSFRGTGGYAQTVQRFAGILPTDLRQRLSLPVLQLDHRSGYWEQIAFDRELRASFLKSWHSPVSDLEGWLTRDGWQLIHRHEMNLVMEAYEAAGSPAPDGHRGEWLSIFIEHLQRDYDVILLDPDW